jgi:hypothetical protein
MIKALLHCIQNINMKIKRREIDEKEREEIEKEEA